MNKYMSHPLMPGFVATAMFVIMLLIVEIIDIEAVTGIPNGTNLNDIVSVLSALPWYSSVAFIVGTLWFTTTITLGAIGVFGLIAYCEMEKNNANDK